MTTVGIRWPRVGGALFVFVGLLIASLIIYDRAEFGPVITTLLAAVPALVGVLFLFGRPQPKPLAYAISLGFQVVITIGFGVEPVYRISTRFDDGDRVRKLGPRHRTDRLTDPGVVGPHRDPRPRADDDEPGPVRLRPVPRSVHRTHRELIRVAPVRRPRQHGRTVRAGIVDVNASRKQQPGTGDITVACGEEQRREPSLGRRARVGPGLEEHLRDLRELHVHVLDAEDDKTFPEIIRAAQALGCDLIVVGTHGRRGLEHFVLGSVAEQVIRRSPIPLLSVRKST